MDLREISLIHCQSYTTAGILVEERLADGKVHEGFHVRNRERLFVQLNGDFVAEGIAEFFEVGALNIGVREPNGSSRAMTSPAVPLSVTVAILRIRRTNCETAGPASV